MPDTGGSSNVTQTQEFHAPSYTTDGSAGVTWQDWLASSKDVNSRPMPNYNVPRVAPINSLQDAGLQMAADRGLNGDPFGNGARKLGLDTMNGNYLEGNGYLDRMIGNNAQNMADAFSSGTAAQNAALSNMQGAFGGSAYTNKANMDALGLAKATGQMGDQARAQNYQFERGMQGQAMGMAPGFAQQDWQDTKGLTGAGDAYSSHEQQLLDSGYQQMQDQINYPLLQQARMGEDLSRASGTGGGSSTISNGGGGMNPFAGLLGLGAGLYGLKAGNFF